MILRRGMIFARANPGLWPFSLSLGGSRHLYQDRSSSWMRPEWRPQLSKTWRLPFPGYRWHERPATKVGGVRETFSPCKNTWRCGARWVSNATPFQKSSIPQTSNERDTPPRSIDLAIFVFVLGGLRRKQEGCRRGDPRCSASQGRTTKPQHILRK